MREGGREERREGAIWKHEEASDLEEEHVLRRHEEFKFGQVSPEMPST